MLSSLPLALPLPTRGGSGLSLAGLFGFEGGEDTVPHPLRGRLPGPVVVNSPLRDLEAKEPLARELSPGAGKLGVGHVGTLKENCGIRKKRLDKLRNPQHNERAMETTTTTEGATLKAAAIAKLNQARRLIDSACEDMCNLEGNGYCDHYERARKLSQSVEALTARYQRLAPPTGLFKW